MSKAKKLKELQALEKQLDDLIDVRMHERAKNYEPYPKQDAFHTMGAEMRERLLMAGNQLGKTYCGAMELSYHLTGEYPDWWEGRTWDRPVQTWCGGVSSIVVRDVMQGLLLGHPFPDNLGQGAIPKENIGRHTLARGVQDAVDRIMIKHKSGGWSTITFKSYEMGRQKWQGSSVDVVWFDEEPPYDVYSEGVTRTNATKGMAYMTFTPLLGMSTVVKKFMDSEGEDRQDKGMVNMTIEDAFHYTPEQRQVVIDSYEEWERDARVQGLPMLGEGRIFTVPEDFIKVMPFEIPRWWAIGAGLDIGIDHPTAAVYLAYDRDNDTIYLVKEHRRKNAPISEHAAAIRAWHPDIPIAWPHDAHARDKGSGEGVKSQYAKQQCKMMPHHAKTSEEEGDTNSVEASVTDLHERMRDGRFKVFNTCELFFEEYRLYHRKDGQIVKEDDDLISAVRYGTMMRRYFRSLSQLAEIRDRRRGGGRKQRAKGVDFEL